MIILSNFGVLEEDDFFIEEYENFLLMEYGETIETCEDFIPYELGDYIYIVMSKDTYEHLSSEELKTLNMVLSE